MLSTCAAGKQKLYLTICSHCAFKFDPCCQLMFCTTGDNKEEYSSLASDKVKKLYFTQAWVNHYEFHFAVLAYLLALPAICQLCVGSGSIMSKLTLELF